MSANSITSAKVIIQHFYYTSVAGKCQAGRGDSFWQGVCDKMKGQWGHLANIFPSEDKEKLKRDALNMLERCFSSKDKSQKLAGYLQCEEEFKLSKTKYSVTKSVESVDADGTIQFIDTYYLTDLADFILLEMMYSLTYNVPIVKCGSCSRFFIAENPTMHYCDNPACRQFGAKKRSKETKQADKLLLLYDKLYQATYYRHKKCTNEKQKEQLNARLKQLMEYRMKYKKVKFLRINLKIY